MVPPHRAPLTSPTVGCVAAGYLNSNETRRSEKIAGALIPVRALQKSSCIVECGVRVVSGDYIAIRIEERIYENIGHSQMNGFRASITYILRYIKLQVSNDFHVSSAMRNCVRKCYRQTGGSKGNVKNPGVTVDCKM